VSDRDNPAPTLDSQNTQTKLDTAVPTAGDAAATLGSAPAVEATARRDLASIGPYRLVKKLGEGGMGQVWLAEQTAPLQRQVALKLIKVGIYEDSVLQRFQSERQSLAIMEHPSIAKVFDAGATVDGQPYFVMEYVPGVPITDYCDQKRLKIRERLELFIKVCEGVQHAHQKAIIHRDLKPANILVAEVDGKPVPRIIDFGLAKAATPQAVAETMFTQVGAFVGTPGYMSPEQADPSVQDVDIRTDVYSLGVGALRLADRVPAIRYQTVGEAAALRSSAPFARGRAAPSQHENPHGEGIRNGNRRDARNRAKAVGESASR